MRARCSEASLARIFSATRHPTPCAFGFAPGTRPAQRRLQGGLMDDEIDRNDPALMAGMLVGHFTAGVMRVVTKYAEDGTLGELVDQYLADRTRLASNADGTVDIENADTPPSAN